MKRLKGGESEAVKSEIGDSWVKALLIDGKVPGLNPTRCLIGLWDLISLQLVTFGSNIDKRQ